MQDKKRVENFWREPPRGLFIHFVLLIKKRRLKSSQKSLTFWGHYTQSESHNLSRRREILCVSNCTLNCYNNFRMFQVFI